MKKSIFFLCFVFFCCWGFSQTNLLTQNKAAIQKGLKQWLQSFSNFSLEDFYNSDTTFFDYKQFGTPPTPIDKKAKSIFETHKPIISASKDKLVYLDLYSQQLALEKRNGKYYSNTDDGGAVLVWNLKEKVFYRIAYSATSSWFEEVLWINANEFILCRVELDSGDNGLIPAPVLYFGNIKTAAFYVFKNKNLRCFQKKEGYRSDKLKKIKIEY